MRDDDRVRVLHMIDAADAVAQFVAMISSEIVCCSYLRG
jgi:hypothetical protein